MQTRLTKDVMKIKDEQRKYRKEIKHLKIENIRLKEH